jgi:hypothetical protein
LPRGVVRVFERYGAGEVFAGEADVEDRPVGLPVELTIGRARDLMLEARMDWSNIERRGQRAVGVAMEHRIVNNKGVPVDVEIRHAVVSQSTLLPYANVKVEQTSRPMRRKYGDLAWRFTVQPGEELLTYRLAAREPDY